MRGIITEEKFQIAKEFFEGLGIQYYDIIPPIDSDIYCVKRIDSQWAAYRIRDNKPIVEFGKYNHMWGFDKGYCLVSVFDEDKTTFSNRGIIDEEGREVIKPYTFLDIWTFYGKKEPYILAQSEHGFIHIDKFLLCSCR